MGFGSSARAHSPLPLPPLFEEPPPTFVSLSIYFPLGYSRDDFVTILSQVVCFFGMFSRQELLRFVFGALDPTMRGFLQVDVFHVRIGYDGRHAARGGGWFIRLMASIERKKTTDGSVIPKLCNTHTTEMISRHRNHRINAPLPPGTPRAAPLF